MGVTLFLAGNAVVKINKFLDNNERIVIGLSLGSNVQHVPICRQHISHFNFVYALKSLQSTVTSRLVHCIMSMSFAYARFNLNF